MHKRLLAAGAKSLQLLATGGGKPKPFNASADDIRSPSNMVSILAVLVSTFLSERSQEQSTPYHLRLPPKIHTILDEDTTRNKRILIIGDVHGCFKELQELLHMAGAYQPDTCIIFTGDLINKGPDNVQVVQFVRQLGAYCVRGNHDEYCLLQYERAFYTDRNPQFDWMDELSDDDLQFLYSLPYTISVPSINALIVHAGLVPGVQLNQQKLIDLLELRNVTQQDQEQNNNQLVGTSKIDHGQPWANVWPGQLHIYFGHDARRGLQLYPFATGLDTGCCYGGSITGVVINPDHTRQFYSVKAKQVYRRPKGTE